MDLSEILRAAGRKWYVFLAGLLVATGLVFLVYRLIPVTYDITASILLLPPNTAVERGEQTRVNPFLGLGDLDVVAAVLARSLTDSATTELIAPTDSTVEYTVVKDLSVSGSVLLVSVSDVSPDGSAAVMNTVLDLAEQRLKELQDAVNATDASQVRSMVITNNVVAEPNYGALMRALIVVAAAGLAGSLLLAVSVDALARRRRARKAARVGSPAPADGPAAAASSDAGLDESRDGVPELVPRRRG